MNEASPTPPVFTERLRRPILEVGLIVLGVLIALGLESAWQYRVDRLNEREVLQGLLEEIDENDSRLEASLATHRRIDSAAEHFLTRASDGGSIEIQDSIISAVIRGPTYLQLRSSLDAALSSGQIELITSSQIQRALASWSQLAAEALEEESDGRQFVSNRLLPLLDVSTDLSVVYQTFVESSERGETGALNWGQSASLVDTSPELENLLWRRRFYAATAITALSDLREHLRATADLIEREML